MKSTPAARAKPKGSRLHRKPKEGIREMKAIERGESQPARMWEVKPDGKGGFVRRPLSHKVKVTERG